MVGKMSPRIQGYTPYYVLGFSKYVLRIIFSFCANLGKGCWLILDAILYLAPNYAGKVYSRQRRISEYRD